MKEIEYNVYRGVYPFDELLGSVIAAADRPDNALHLAIAKYHHQDIHPVVAPA